jgi:hypothetical protein
MSKEAALYQSLAASGATLIAFIGVCHEVIGHVIFPWAPAFFGGPVGWHALGVFAISVGLLLLGGVLRLVKIPVVPVSLLVTAIGIAVACLAAVRYQQFHMFALAASLSGIVTAACHRRAMQEAARAAASAASANGASHA